MDKAGLVEEVAGKIGLTKKDVGIVVDAVTERVTDSLSKGEKVVLVGFGTFQVMERKARRGREITAENPTDKKYSLPGGADKNPPRSEKCSQNPGS